MLLPDFLLQCLLIHDLLLQAKLLGAKTLIYFVRSIAMAPCIEEETNLGIYHQLADFLNKIDLKALKLPYTRVGQILKSRAGGYMNGVFFL